jgi:hypothetical protein
VGSLNLSWGDVSVFLPLEQAQLARLVSDRDRTRLFARYSFIGSIMAAVGSLGAALPEAAVALSGAELKPALQAAFLLYAALGGLALLLYRSLPPRVEPADPRRPLIPTSSSTSTRPCSTSICTHMTSITSTSTRAGRALSRTATRIGTLP